MFFLKKGVDFFFLYKFCFFLSESSNYFCNKKKTILEFFFFLNIKNAQTCHRLDENVSGIIYLVNKKSLLENFKIILFIKKFIKNYICLSLGNNYLREYNIKIPTFLVNCKKYFLIKQIFSNLGGNSITYLKDICKSKKFNVFNIFPITGKTHQIRFHLSFIGFPIFRDNLYYIKTDFNKNLFLFLSYININFLFVKFRKLRISVPPYFIFFLINNKFNINYLNFFLKLN